MDRAGLSRLVVAAQRALVPKPHQCGSGGSRGGQSATRQAVRVADARVEDVAALPRSPCRIFPDASIWARRSSCAWP